jgi:uncharacterized protein with PIN domain
VPTELRFACDAMCGGLARWLRAIGYDATWSPDIDDGELVRLADEQGRFLLSSDNGMFERRLIAGGQVPALLIPLGLRRLEQLKFVVEQLKLRVKPPRCMACGGPLLPVTREQVAAEVPARSLVWARSFYRCGQCAKVFWEGSHWRRIEKVRQATAGLAPPQGGGSDTARPGSGAEPSA